MGEFAPDSWDSLVPAIDSPLVGWEWLNHLETSGSICPETGWHPIHLGAFEGDRLVGAAPAYLHAHSWGEFVFDFAWAEVAQQLGKKYYPKLVGASPATPSTAYSIRLKEGEVSRERWYAAFLEEFIRFARANEVAVVQFNFIAPQEVEYYRAAGFHIWRHHSFAWHNDGFANFDDYLARFRKGPRRNIRRERRSMDDQGIAVSMVRGDRAPERYWRHMAELYHRTNDQFGPYAARFLTSEFFEEMPPKIRRHLWFSAAHRNGDNDPVALALLLRGTDRVYGRYWGAYEEIEHLHFNVCYYTPIEWAITEGIPLFDPGMGSAHKVRRGFGSEPTFSAHYFLDAEMQAILAANIGRINAHEDAQIAELNTAVPYRIEPPLPAAGGGGTVQS